MLYRYFLKQASLNRLIGLIAMLWGFQANAQQKIKFTHLTNLDGLSQSTVQAMVRDKFGFIWFGTQDGLNRYDGYNFKVYRHQPNDSNSLRKSHINCLFEDSAGDLWVGTSNGALSKYDKKNDRFIHYKEMIGNRPGLSQKTVTSIYEDKQNNFWIGTYWKLNLLNRATGEIVQYGHDPADPNSISNDGITCMLEDSRNNLWIGTYNGLNILDRKTKKFRRIMKHPKAGSISDNQINTVYEDSSGKLWIGTGNGLNLYDHRTGNFTIYQHDAANPLSLGDNGVTHITDAGNNKLWIGTKSTLELFDIARGEFQHFISDPNIATTLSKNGNVTSLMRRDGILWVGTYQGGINKYDEHLTYFDLYRNNPQDWESLSFNVVTSFAEKPDGNIWVATGGGALNLLNRSTGKFTRFNPEPGNPHSLSTYGILCLFQGKRNDYLWIGTYGMGVDRYDPATGRFKNIPKGEGPDQLNNDAVYAIMEDSRGRIWMGTNGGGVNVLDQETGIISRFMNDPNDPNTVGGNFIRCFYEDRKGNIWIGSTGGVSIYHPGKRSFSHINQGNSNIESDVIFSFLEDLKGNMWIGTLGGGLISINAKDGKIESYNSSHGLPDNTINNIQQDAQGYLWISTNNGLTRFDPEKRSFRNSSLDNGIQSYEFSQGAGLRSRNGEILFGGVNGFNIIDPGQLIQNSLLPPVVFTDFRLFNKSVPIGEDQILKQSILETREIELSHKDYIFSFEFSALGFTAPDRNEYAYMLVGFDDDWIQAGNNRKVTYTNLDAGTYYFRVKASNNDGVWSEAPATIKIIIRPPFWKTWWFRLLILVAFVSIIFLIFRSRTRQIKNQKILLEKQVRERTERLATMTLEERKSRQAADEANRELERKNRELEQFAYVASHDLQEPLRTITSFSSLLSQQYKGKLDERSDKYLDFINQASDRMKVLINDLLEYSRLGRKKEMATVDCNALLNEVTADLNLALTEANAQIRLHQLPVLNAYPSELKQVFQNLISNAIKFRKKDEKPEVSISAEKVNGCWKFLVKDNGIGIDPKHNERIFAIFQRLHTRSEYEGSGIGLSNCRKIIEMHKGKIWVESEPGKGSSFYFTLAENETVQN